ncbi:unnamed protein product, partial [Ectocarpus sp. 12 AP-2014]
MHRRFLRKYGTPHRACPFHVSSRYFLSTLRRLRFFIPDGNTLQSTRQEQAKCTFTADFTCHHSHATSCHQPIYNISASSRPQPYHTTPSYPQKSNETASSTAVYDRFVSLALPRPGLLGRATAGTGGLMVVP